MNTRAVHDNSLFGFLAKIKFPAGNDVFLGNGPVPLYVAMAVHESLLYICIAGVILFDTAGTFNEQCVMIAFYPLCSLFSSLKETKNILLCFLRGVKGLFTADGTIISGVF
jgi:hypothetical protein